MGDLTTRLTNQVLEQEPQPHIKYCYAPLKSPSNFRTLKIKPGQYENELECSLHEGYPGDGTVYYALSYVWGPSIFPRQIYCDGYTLSITESLFSALRNYRQVDRPVTIWADAICINQEDIEERSCQVLLMQEIYSKSKQLCIWLGEKLEFCSEAFKYMLDVVDIFGYPSGPDIKNTAVVNNVMHAAFERITEDSLTGLVELFENPWFRRAWTFQELVCGLDAEISVGDLTLSFDVVFNWVVIARVFNVPGGIFSVSSRLAMGQVEIMRAGKTERSELYPMAVSTRVWLSTDPRDKIHSLMGIATDIDSLPFRPDYNVAVDDLFYDFAVHTITNSNSLDLLRLCNTVVAASYRPSWVVDWSNWQATTYDIDSKDYPFCAAGNKLAGVYGISINGYKLSVNGLLVEEIAVMAKSGFRGISEEEEIEVDEEDLFKPTLLKECKLYEEIL